MPFDRVFTSLLWTSSYKLLQAKPEGKKYTYKEKLPGRDHGL